VLLTSAACPSLSPQDDNIFDEFDLEMRQGGRAGTVLSAAVSVYDER
jgi:hypothetical protein